jgi:hypothetical protein
MKRDAGPKIDVRRSAADKLMLLVVLMFWVGLAVYVLIRLGTGNSLRTRLIIGGAALGVVAIAQNSRLRVWTRSSKLCVRNGWIKRKYAPASIESFTARSYAGQHWLVEMRLGSGKAIAIHATDRRTAHEADEFTHQLVEWRCEALGIASVDQYATA